MEKKPMNYETNFNIEKLSFDNVSRDFEKEFKESYSKALSAMSDSKDRLTNASGANSLGILEKMAQHIKDYDKNSDFSDSYHKMQEEFEPFTET